jgi:fibro-slime domain-containing protein
MTSTRHCFVLPLFLFVVAGLVSVQGCGGASNGGGSGSDGGAFVGSGGIVLTGAGGGGGFGGLDAPAVQGNGGMIGTGGESGISVDGSAITDVNVTPSCGQPGTLCCDGNSCTGGGCCVSGICMAQGSTCATLGGICSAGSCGNCGSPSQSCCGAKPATGVCTSSGTICSAGICAKCGDLGKACCTSASGGDGTCNGPNAMCSGDNLCVACGTPGSACCSGNQCDNPGCCYNHVCTDEGSTCGASGGICQAGRCSACGGASQPCCANVCYEGLLCKGGTCTGCGGLGQACCTGGAGTCQTGMACTGSGGVCSACGSLGDMCCAGNTCNVGCCSGGVCLAPGTANCPSGSPDGGGQVDAPMGSGGDGGMAATGGAGGTTVPTSGTGGTTITTGGAGGTTAATGGVGGGTTAPWTPPAGCGDGVVVFPERCDDGNTMPFDGCSSDCQNEPICTDGACTSKCGDGIVLGEECDDGNTADGDGCSSACAVEQGWTCAQPNIGDKMLVPVVYRDFKFHRPTDFEDGITGAYAPFPGMVNATLDANGKPVFSDIVGKAHVASADSFSQWYKDVSGVNHSTASKLALWNDGKGNYVNRYGANGEQWNTTASANWCGTVEDALLDASGNPIPCTYKYQVGAGLDSATAETDCQAMEAKGYTQLPGSCHSYNGTYKALYIVAKVDGNPLFFPVDGDPFTPTSELLAASIPPYYDASATWPFDLDAAGNKRLHNFSFTSEVHYWFKYDKTKNYTLDFVGDDDVWVFINRKLAIDIGGIHIAVAGTLVIGADGNGTTTVTPTYPVSPAPTPTIQATALGLEDGKVYEIAVFQAERQSNGSSYKLTLGGFNTAPSACQTN